MAQVSGIFEIIMHYVLSTNGPVWSLGPIIEVLGIDEEGGGLLCRFD